MHPPIPEEEARQIIADYTQAIEKRLRPALEAAKRQKARAEEMIIEAEQMQNSLAMLDDAKTNQIHTLDETDSLPPKLQTRVNIGEEFYINAHVYKLEPLIVDVGYNYLVEMTREEAQQFVEKRKSLFQSQLESSTKRIEQVQAQVRRLLCYLNELLETTSQPELYTRQQ